MESGYKRLLALTVFKYHGLRLYLRIRSAAYDKVAVFVRVLKFCGISRFHFPNQQPFQSKNFIAVTILSIRNLYRSNLS